MPCSCCGGSGTSCCKKLVLPPECVAAGIEYYSCDQVSDEECLSTSPTATRCTPNGNKPASSAPYNCVNETYKSGAWVKIENWTLSGYNVPSTSRVGQVAERLLNATFYIENRVCTLPSGKLFNFTVPSSESECFDTNWGVRIDLRICEESVIAQVFAGVFCLNPIGMDYVNPDANNFLVNPCPGGLCICKSYGGANNNAQYANGGDGTVQVYPA